ncbi:MAG: EamA family transporter [Cytophagales bacterium]|nr:EamA family transporter [Cytophagales bacterium]
MKTFSTSDYLSALFVVVIWGSNFVVMKYGLQSFTPFQLGVARYFFAAFPLIFFIARPALPFKFVVLYGLFQGVGQFGFVFTALHVGMTAALASVLMQTQVFFTAIIGWLVMREPLSRRQQAGLLLAALAVACFGMDFTDLAPSALASVTVLGFLLCLCGASLWGASNIVARQAQSANPHFSALHFVVWTSIIPIVPFALLSYVLDAPSARANWANASAISLAAAAYLGLLGSILGYTLWTKLLKRHSANRVAPFSLGVPVVGLAAGICLLGEQVSHWQWAGIVFVIAALGVSCWPRSKQT